MNKHIEQVHALNLAFSETEQTLTAEIAALTQRQQEVGAQLLALQQQAEQEKAEQAAIRSEQEHALRSEHAEREHTLSQQLNTSQQELHRLEQERVHREKDYTEQSNQARQELESLLRTQVQHEQTVAEKLEAVRNQAAQESAKLVHSLTEQQHAVQSQCAARELALGQQLEAQKQERIKREQTLHDQTSQARQEVENLLRAQVQREREVLAQLLGVQQQATREKADLARDHSGQERTLLRQQSDREKAHNQQLVTQQEEFRHLQREQSKREQFLLEDHSKTRQHFEGLRHTMLQREQEVFAQLLGSQQQAAQEKAELLQKQSEQELVLHRLHTDRETALTQQLQELQQLLQRQQEHRAQLETALNNEIATLQSETQVLHQAQQLQAQQHGLEINTQLDKHTRLLDACAALEAQVQAEIQTRQQASLQLRQLLTEVQHSLEITRTSLSWRITAPLRKLAGLFTSNTNQTLAPVKLSESIPLGQDMQVATEPPPITVTQASHEPAMPPLAQATSLNMPTTASTLEELLACHDQQFVNCAYRTLLGRTPDPEGLRYYLGRLRTGLLKIQILAQLRLSNEGRTYATKLPGLDTAIKRYQKEQYPLIGWLFRRINGAESNNLTERKLRGIENQIFLFNSENTRCFYQIKTAIVDLKQILTVQQKLDCTNSLETSLIIGIDNTKNQSLNNKKLEKILKPLTVEDLIVISREIV